MSDTINKHDYLRMLTEGHATMDECQGQGRTSRLAYLAEYIFNFTTYESEMAEMFAGKALEVCAAISDKQTFDYIDASSENRMWYLLMCNMPFFADKLEWGTSIRGAWWGAMPGGKIKFDSCGLWLNDKQLHEPMAFTREQWGDFISAVREFSDGEERSVGDDPADLMDPPEAFVSGKRVVMLDLGKTGNPIIPNGGTINVDWSIDGVFQGATTAQSPEDLVLPKLENLEVVAVSTAAGFVDLKDAHRLFEDWAREYFGENVPVPEACRDAWLAAREACAKVCEETDYYERTGFEYAEDIRERVK